MSPLVRGGGWCRHNYCPARRINSQKYWDVLFQIHSVLTGPKTAVPFSSKIARITNTPHIKHHKVQHFPSFSDPMIFLLI